MVCSVEEMWIGTTEDTPHDNVSIPFERPVGNRSLEMCPDGTDAECFHVLSRMWPFSVCRDSRLLCAYRYHSKNNFRCWHRDMDCSGPVYCPTMIDNTAYICRTGSDDAAQFVLQPFNDFREPCDMIMCTANKTSNDTIPFRDMSHSFQRSSECPGGVDECECVLSETWPVCKCRDAHLICMYDYDNGQQVFSCWHDSMTCGGPAICLIDPHHRAYICRMKGFEELVLQPFIGMGEPCETEKIRCWNKTLTIENFTDNSTTLSEDTATAFLGTCIALRFSISGHLPDVSPVWAFPA